MLHQPVLLQEVLAGLAILPNGIYVDATFGRGGHSQGLLQQLSSVGRLIAIDQDAAAITYAHQHFGHDRRFRIYHGSFAKLPMFAKDADIYGKINGILLDLGLSTPQLTNPERGFSFMHAGPLDMRMNTEQKLIAADFINKASATEMAALFKAYGEERFSKRIANAIVAARCIAPICTTEALAAIIKKANPCWEKHKHPATRVFQAIRIYINNELNDLATLLQNVISCLAVGGRLLIISFHSLEDRMVKQFMRTQEQSALPVELPVTATALKINFKRIGKAIKASRTEILHNLKARSAILRIGEKIA